MKNTLNYIRSTLNCIKGTLKRIKYAQILIQNAHTMYLQQSIYISKYCCSTK